MRTKVQRIEAMKAGRRFGEQNSAARHRITQYLKSGATYESIMLDCLVEFLIDQEGVLFDEQDDPNLATLKTASRESIEAFLFGVAE